LEEALVASPREGLIGVPRSNFNRAGARPRDEFPARAGVRGWARL